MQTVSLTREFPRLNRWVRMVNGIEQVPIARSPREVVFTRDKLTLYRYQRETPARYRTPILLVYSLINRPAILDLIPGRSVIEHLLQRGFDVYLLDWGVPDPLDQHNGMDLHINLLIRTIVREVCKSSGEDAVSLLGYCMGGTMAAIYTALHPGRVKNLILLGAPFDFRSNQKLYQWGCDKKFFDPRKYIEAFGNVPTWAFEGFSMLDPGSKYPRMVSLYDQQDNDAFVESYLAMEQWVGDNIPMGGAIYEEFIRTCWQENQLIEGRLEIGGRRVDLREISCPTLIIAGKSDHLVPSETTLPLLDMLPDAHAIVFPSGHIGLSVSSNSHRKLWPQACDWLAERSNKAS